MQPPQVDHRGKSQEKRANRPTEEPVWGEAGPYLVDRISDQPHDPEATGEAIGAPVSAFAVMDEPEAAPAKPAKQSPRVLLNTQEALALRASGWSVNDIAARLGVSNTTVTHWFTTHRRKVDAARITQKLDQVAVPLAVENLIHGLLAGDKDYTVKTLEGRGQFRRHVQEQGTVTHDLPPLKIEFVGGPAALQDPADSAKSVSGMVVGRPALPLADPRATRTVDAEIGMGVPSRPSSGE
jgi:predicted DNA-binding protein (UPF0251 family)